MNRRLIEIIWFVAIVVLSCVATSAQNSGTPKPQIEYKRGQIWEYLGGQETVTVLEVEDIRNLGPVVHVRIDRVPATGCQGLRFTTSLEHIALTEKMLRKSQIRLLRENEEIPETYLGAYRDWQKQKKHRVLKDQTIDDVIPTAPQPGAICNVLPATT